jgi:hypothetical protein
MRCGVIFPTDILGQPVGPIFKDQEIRKREQSAAEVTDSFLLWDFFHHPIFTAA